MCVCVCVCMRNGVALIYNIGRYIAYMSYIAAEKQLSINVSDLKETYLWQRIWRSKLPFFHCVARVASHVAHCLQTVTASTLWA